MLAPRSAGAGRPLCRAGEGGVSVGQERAPSGVGVVPGSQNRTQTSLGGNAALRAGFPFFCIFLGLDLGFGSRRVLFSLQHIRAGFHTGAIYQPSKTLPVCSW